MRRSRSSRPGALEQLADPCPSGKSSGDLPMSVDWPVHAHDAREEVPLSCLFDRALTAGCRGLDWLSAVRFEAGLDRVLSVVRSLCLPVRWASLPPGIDPLSSPPLSLGTREAGVFDPPVLGSTPALGCSICQCVASELHSRAKSR